LPPDIPVLRKKDREKRGGLLPFTSGGGGGGGSFLYRVFGLGQAGGSASVVGGAAGRGAIPAFIDFITSQGGLSLALTAASATAVFVVYSVGMAAVRAGGPLGPQGGVFPASGAMASAAQAQAAPGGASSLGVVASVNRGLYGEEAQDAAAAEPEPEPEQKASSEPGQAPQAEPAAQGSQDPGAPAAAEQAAQTPEPKLVASPGFRGGGGLVSGRALGEGNGLAGGNGLSGGMVRTFSQPTLGGGVKALQPMRAGRKPAAVRSLRTKPIQRSNSALKQLRFANRESVRARRLSTAEGRSYAAANAFEPAAGGAGAPAGGAGMSQSASPSASQGSDGGPLTEGSSVPGEEKAPGTGKSGDVSPWTRQVMLAMSLLMAASTIVTIIGILAIFKMMPMVGSIAAMIQAILLVIATGMASTASALGVEIMRKYGQMEQGAILTAGGAITAAAAIHAMMSPSGPSWPQVLGGIAGIGSAVAALLSSAKMPGGPFK